MSTALLSYPNYDSHSYSCSSAAVTAFVGERQIDLEGMLSIEVSRKVAWNKSWGHSSNARTRTRGRVDYDAKIKLLLPDYNLLIAALEDEGAGDGFGPAEVSFRLTCTLYERGLGTTMWEFEQCAIADENVQPIPDGDHKPTEVALELSVMTVVKDRIAIAGGRAGATARSSDGRAPFWGLNDNGQSPNDAPLFASDPWDTFWIDGRRMPGECRLEPGGVAALEVIKKKTKGSNYARLTFGGYDPREFQLRVQLATPEQWAEYQDLLEIFWPAPSKERSRLAVRVAHPNLAPLKIFTAMLVGVSPLADAFDGAKYSTWRFQEQLPASTRNVTKTADSPKPLLDQRKQPGFSALSPANAPPPPPESVAANMSTKGPN